MTLAVDVEPEHECAPIAIRVSAVGKSVEIVVAGNTTALVRASVIIKVILLLAPSGHVMRML